MWGGEPPCERGGSGMCTIAGGSLSLWPRGCEWGIRACDCECTGLGVALGLGTAGQG